MKKCNLGETANAIFNYINAYTLEYGYSYILIHFSFIKIRAIKFNRKVS